MLTSNMYHTSNLRLLTAFYDYCGCVTRGRPVQFVLDQTRTSNVRSHPKDPGRSRKSPVSRKEMADFLSEMLQHCTWTTALEPSSMERQLLSQWLVLGGVLVFNSAKHLHLLESEPVRQCPVLLPSQPFHARACQFEAGAGCPTRRAETQSLPSVFSHVCVPLHRPQRDPCSGFYEPCLFLPALSFALRQNASCLRCYQRFLLSDATTAARSWRPLSDSANEAPALQT